MCLFEFRANNTNIENNLTSFMKQPVFLFKYSLGCIKKLYSAIFTLGCPSVYATWVFWRSSRQKSSRLSRWYWIWGKVSLNIKSQPLKHSICRYIQSSNEFRHFSPRRISATPGDSMELGFGGRIALLGH